MPYFSILVISLFVTSTSYGRSCDDDPFFTGCDEWGNYCRDGRVVRDDNRCRDEDKSLRLYDSFFNCRDDVLSVEVATAAPMFRPHRGILKAIVDPEECRDIVQSLGQNREQDARRYGFIRFTATEYKETKSELEERMVNDCCYGQRWGYSRRVTPILSEISVRGAYVGSHLQFSGVVSYVDLDSRGVTLDTYHCDLVRELPFCPWGSTIGP